MNLFNEKMYKFFLDPYSDFVDPVPDPAPDLDSTHFSVSASNVIITQGRWKYKT
jgi:hypothetical protein